MTSTSWQDHHIPSSCFEHMNHGHGISALVSYQICQSGKMKINDGISITATVIKKKS